MTIIRPALAAAALALLAAACSSPTEEGVIDSIEPLAGGGCAVTLTDDEDGTEDTTHNAGARFCEAAQVGDHAEFEDGDEELGFTQEDED
jgi:hypothetical protein